MGGLPQLSGLAVRLLLIDETTTTAYFADRIRWNQAYSRLASRL